MIDDDTPGVNVTPASASTLNLTEGGSGTFSVTLNSYPTGDVTVALTKSGVGNDSVELSTNSLTFTQLTYDIPQVVTVTANQDDDALANAITLTLDPSGADYGTVASKTVTVNVADNDSYGYDLTPEALTIEEGAGGSFTVAMTAAPRADTTVTLESSSTYVTIADTDSVRSGTQDTLKFTSANWDTAQTVTLNAAQDSNDVSETATITLSTTITGVTGAITDTLDVTVNDDDDPNLQLSKSALTATEGGSTTFTVRLTVAPTAAVTVRMAQSSLVDSNSDVTINPGTVSFITSEKTTACASGDRHWNCPQTVTVSAVDDNDALDDSATIVLTGAGGNYAGVTRSIDLSVTDTDTPAMAVTGSPLTVTEGSSGSFTVKLDTQPGGNVAVALSQTGTFNSEVLYNPSALIFTPTSWNTAQTVTVNSLHDDDSAADSATINLRAAGGEYDDVSASVSVSVTDDDSPALRLSGTRLSVDEGGSETFTVELATEPSGTVTVTPSHSAGSADVTFPLTALSFTASDWNRPRSITVSAAQDDDAADDTATILLTAAGGGYASVTGSVGVTVDDDEEAGLDISLPSLTVSEGSSGTFTVRLTSQPSASVTVTLTKTGSGDITHSPTTALTFTTTDWSTAKTITVTSAEDDDIVQDNAVISLSASNGGYAGLSGSVSVSAPDNDGAQFKLSESALRPLEGSSATFTVALKSQPSANVTVTLNKSGSGDVTLSPTGPLSFSTANWSTTQTVTVSAAEDDDAVADSASIALSASGGGYGSATGSLSVSVIENDTVGLELSESALTLDEGGSATFTVTLKSQPSATVTVTLGGTTGTDLTLNPATPLSFTTSDWNTEKTVTVSAAEDGDTVRDNAVINLSASGGGYGSTAGTLSVSVIDNDAPGLTFSSRALPVNEGSNATFTVRLNTQPSAAVTLTVARAEGSSDVTFDTDSATGVQTTIDFTTAEKTTACAPADKHWNCPRTVTVSAAADTDAVDDRATLSVSAAGGNYAGLSGDVAVTVDDDETADLTVSLSTLTVTEGGSAGSFTVRLATQPSAPVTVNLSVGNSGDVTVSPASLSFTTGNWRTTQSVSVSATDDDDASNGSATIRLNAVGGDYAGQTDSVSVTVTDDDTAGLSLSQTSLSIAEGGSKLLTVALKTRPSAAVTVTLVQTGTSNSDVSFVPASLSFEPDSWGALQTVVVSGRQDNDADNDSATIRLSGTNGGYGSVRSDVSVTVVDDDTPGLTLSPSSLTLNEGASGSFTVVLDTPPSGAVTVLVTKSGDASLTLGSASLEFTASTWNTAKTVTVTAGEDDNAVRDSGTISLSASGGGYAGVSGSLSVSVPDNDIPELRLSESALTVDEGASGTFKVRLSAQPSATVTVSLGGTTGTDLTLSPAPLSFTTTDWSTEKTVTVTAGQDDDTSDDSASISLSAADGGYGSVSKNLSVTVTDDDEPALTVSASRLDLDEGGAAGTFTVKLAKQPSGNVTVSVTKSGDANLTLGSPSLSFTTSNWNTVQTVTVTAGDDANGVDERAEIKLSASGADYAGVSKSVTVTVDDNDTVGMTLSRTSLTPTEGTSVTFTAKLDTQPSDTVTVNLAVGGSGDVTLNDASALIFTTGNWSSVQPVTVHVAEDDDAIADSAHVSLAASGGDYGGITGRVTVSVTENDTLGLDISESSLTVNEGADGDFTVALKTQPSANVTVSLTQQGVSNTDIGIAPASLVFTPSNWSTAREVTVSAAEDDDAIADSARIQLGASGGGYGSATGRVSVSVTENDTVDLVLSKRSLNVDEGAGDSFTVALKTQPSAAVTVSLTRSSGSGDVVLGSTSLSFTRSNWSAPKIVTLTVSEDDDSQNERATISLSASGGDYVGQTDNVSVSVADDDEVKLNISASKLSVVEQLSSSFTVALDTQPSASVTVDLTRSGSSDISFSPASLTFTTSSWGTAQTVSVNAANDDDTQDDEAIIALAASGGDYGGQSGSVEVTATDNDAAGLSLSERSLTIVEGAGKTFDVSLTTQPSAAVTVTLTRIAGGSADVTLSASSLSFTTGNWSTAQTVTVSAAEDDDALADSASISVSASGGGYDSQSGSVSVSVTENDTAALTLSKSSLPLDEGASGTFTVRLATQPSGGVTVNLTTSGDDDVTIDKPSLVFTDSNWETAQTVTVSAGQDNDAVGDSATISLSASGGSYGGVIGSLSVTVTDDDAPGLDISVSSLTLEEGKTTAFTVALDTQPSAAVSVSLRQSGTVNTDVSLIPTSLSFTASNWGAPQTVTVSTIRDSDATDDSATLSVSASGGGYGGASGSIAVTVTDLDTTALVLSASSLTVREGSDSSFTVQLQTQPSGAVSVSLVQPGAGNADVMLSSASLDFSRSDWNVAQEVTVSAAEDNDAIEDRATISLSATGGGYTGKTGSVSVTVNDNDSTGLSVSKDSLTVTEGSSGSFTVSLATQPSSEVSVSVMQPAGSDNSDVTLSTASLRFKTATAGDVSDCTDEWNCPQTVTVSAAEDDDSLGEGATINLAATGGGYNDLDDSVTVTVTDNDTPGLTLSDSTLSLDEGGSGSFMVKLVTQPSSGVTVNLSRSGSSDVTLGSAQLSFSTTNWSTNQSVTVNAARDSDAQDDEATISLSAVGGGYDGQAGSVRVSVTDSSAVGLVLSDQSLHFDEGDSGSFTVRLQTQPSAAVSVVPSQTGTTNPDVTLSPAKLDFTTDNWRSVQRVTVSAVEDADALGDSATVLLTATGGDYARATGRVPVTINDLDVVDLALSVLKLTIREGGSGTFTVSLETQPSAGVEVQLTRSGGSSDVSFNPSSLDFTTTNWSAPQTVTVSAAEDTDAIEDSATISLSATGGSYGTAFGSIAVMVTDNETVGLEVSKTSTGIGEGSSSGADNTFTVVLATQPSDDVEVQLTRSGSGDVSVSPGSLDFTTTNWSTAQTVTLSAAEDDDAVDDEATISISTTGGDYAGLSAQVDVDVEDNDEIGITVQPSPVVVREGGASSRIRVALVTQPSAPVTLTLSQTGSINNDVEFDTDSTQTGSQSTLSFTTQNWAQQQPVEISAKDDTDSTDDTASILLSAQGGDYSGLTTTVRVDVTDDDRPNLVVSQGELTVDEGESTSFTVQLSTQPSASVTVGLTVPEGGEVTLDGDAVQSGVQGAVVFTDQNWNQARVVTVATLHDDDAVDDFHTLSLSVSSDSGPAEYRGASASVSLTVKDDEKPGISVTPASLEITEGSSKEFEVALTSQPPSSVVVTIAQAANAFIEFDTDADSQGSQSELRFNAENWSTGQTVTVTALQDVDSQDAEETLRLSSSGSGYNGYQAGVEVTVKDDDQPALELTRNNLAISDPVALDEGESATIGVRLVSRPSEAVVVSLSSSDADAVTVSPRTLDFTQGNWGVVQNFTVTGADDADSVDEEVQISLTTSGGNYEGRSASLQVTVDDDESAGLNISQTELTVVEGENKTLTVTLNNQPVGDVTVDLTTSSGAVTVSPVQLVFKEASWSGGLDVTVSGVDDHDRVDGEDVILLTASGGGYDRIVERVTVTVQDDDVAALKLSDEELNVPEGGSASFVVSLSVEPTDSVAVAIAGIDASAILCIPDRLSFTRENWTQPQVITVIGLQDDDTDDDDSPLNLVASGADYDGIRAQLAVTVVDQDEAVSEAEVEAAEGVLEEFGRTLLGSTVDVIARRFGALPGRAAADVGGAEVEVGGEGAFERALQGALRHFGGAAGAERGADDTADAADHLMRLGSIRLRDGRPLRLGQSATERRDPLLREFTYPLGGPGGETTAWMRFNRGEFSGEFRELGQGYDGSQDGIWVGIDQRFGNGVLFGAAVSENSGDAQYSIFSGGSSILMDTRLLMVMPYIEIPVRGGGMLSLILGSGGGEIDSLEADGSKSRAYLSVQMFSLGTKWPLTRLGRRISLSLTGSIGSSRLGTSCSTQIALCGLNSSGGRMSVGVELAHDEMQMSRNWKMTPRYAMSLRQDSGSQSKGGGMELSGSASMAAPGDRFSIDVGLRWLAMHATEAYEEWGGSVELQLRSRDEAGRGLSLGLGPQWGSSQSDVLQRRGAFGADPRELQRMRGEAGRAAMRASAGYGVDLWAGLLTPFAEYSVSGGEAASSRLQGGLRYRSGETLEGRLFGEWETGQGIQPQSRIGLELSRRF